MTIDLTTAELAQELTRRQDAAQQEQQRQAATLQAAREAWAAHTIANHEAIEKQLEDDGAASMAAAVQAVKDGDLPGAFIGYTNWHASRYARTHLRDATNSAYNIIGSNRTLTSLRLVDVSFNKWLNDQCSAAASKNGVDIFEAVNGPNQPTSYDEAVAWNEATNGE